MRGSRNFGETARVVGMLWKSLDPVAKAVSRTLLPLPRSITDAASMSGIGKGDEQ